MTVDELIKLLQKVQHKEASVIIDHGETWDYVDSVVIHHDLKDDEILVVLNPTTDRHK